MKIAILGTGNLGKAIARGILHSNGATSMFLTRRNLAGLEEFRDYDKVTLSTDNREAVAHSDILILAVQPGQVQAVVEDFRDLLHENHVLLSTVTGVSTSQLESWAGNEHSIIRCMPNTAISVGESMTCLCSNKAGTRRLDLASAIFKRMGSTMVIPESRMQAATVICASGIAFWMRLIRATTQAAIQLGFEAEQAKELAVHTCHGAASLLIANGKHPEEEIDRVTTPRGCTIEGLNEMEHQGLSSSLIKGVVASYNKIEDIKQE